MRIIVTGGSSGVGKATAPARPAVAGHSVRIAGPDHPQGRSGDSPR